MTQGTFPEIQAATDARQVRIAITEAEIDNGFMPRTYMSSTHHLKVSRLWADRLQLRPNVPTRKVVSPELMAK